MRQPKGVVEYGKNGCCPSDWDHTPNMTGDHIMDGSIKSCKNVSAASKLADHLTTNMAYQRTKK